MDFFNAFVYLGGNSRTLQEEKEEKVAHRLSLR